MSEPDFAALLGELDGQDMAGYTRRFVDDLRTAMGADVDVEQDASWSGVLCLGMGGSGSGGLFLKALSDDSGGLPFVVWRDYGVPSWWGPDWLVFATSYSGNTEETLSASNEALQRGAKVVAMTTGGKLEQLANRGRAQEDSDCLVDESWEKVFTDHVDQMLKQV